MSRFPVLRPREIARALERAGFVLDRIKGSHHIYKHPNQPRAIVIPFHPGTIKPSLLAKIVKEAGLTREEFLRHL
ncbi:MAG TPA: type II toxin-antitoxin system HicA family toxin [Myxococcota bacterium]|nr:type II toxin-antitoxin system HicA family toxin [Myxococcota bacterium]